MLNNKSAGSPPLVLTTTEEVTVVAVGSLRYTEGEGAKALPATDNTAPPAPQAPTATN
jgi:hypothetical protein